MPAMKTPDTEGLLFMWQRMIPMGMLCHFDNPQPGAVKKKMIPHVYGATAIR